MRVALYARFSDDTQNPRSTGDQIALLTTYAVRRGWQIVGVHQDDAISGFAIANRPGLLEALAVAEAGGFDLLLAEDEDRIARSLEHLAHVVNRLTFARAKLATLTCDHVQTMQVAMKGFAAEDFLRNLAQKTSRGMAANAERGLATGSRLYGYATSPGGAVQIVEDQAEVIRRAFTLFADERMSGREIAHAFNRERIPGPRGGPWNASTLLGNPKRGNGVLRSEIYAGQKVWNREEVRKDPRTGKRQHHFRPPSEWKRTAVEHLRIVPDDLWSRAQARLTGGAQISVQKGAANRKGVFSGLFKCACGASYTSYSKTSLVCAANRNQGAVVCGNSRKVNRREVEERVLEGLRTRLLSPAAVRAYVRLYHEAWEAETRAERERRRPLDRRLGELSRRIERIVDAICDGQATAAMRERLVAMEQEKTEIENELAQMPEEASNVVTAHPVVGQVYAEQVAELQRLLADIAADPAKIAEHRPLIDSVRDLIVKVEIIPHGAGRGGEIELKLHGNLSLLLTPKGETAISPQRGYLMVAGARSRQTPPAMVMSLWPRAA